MQRFEVIKNSCRQIKKTLERNFCSQNGKEFQAVVSTLRVDRVASSGFAVSRRKTDLAFLAKLLYLNGEIVTKKSEQVKVGDTIDLIRKEECTAEIAKFDSINVVEMIEKTFKGKDRIILSRKRAISLEWAQFKTRFSNQF